MPSLAQLGAEERDLIEDILATKPGPEDHLGATVIVDGCPTIGQAKYDLLKKFLLDKLGKVGKITDCDFPFDEELGSTKGYMFVTYETSKAASQAIKTLNNSPLDKNHTLRVTALAEYERAINAPTEWKPPPKQEYTDFGNLKSWLLNEFCRDQFAVVFNEVDGVVYWHSTVGSIEVERRQDWTSGWIEWSPRGTYLSTVHRLGVILWGGEKFLRIGRFPHQGVAALDFSPMENFIVTRSRGSSAPVDDPNRPMSDVVVWDIRRACKGRDFCIPSDIYPVFKWSHNDAYFACLRDGLIAIYETGNNYCLLDKKRIGTNICDFAWSPTECLLAYWVPEADNIPARVAVMELPSRRELCTKNLFSVVEIDLCWHDQGHFVAFKILRCAKKKVDNVKQVKYVGTYTNIEVIRMREKLYPVDKLEIKASVNCFAWEPSGTRFAFIQTLPNNKSTVSIYDVPLGASIREVSSIEVPTARSWHLSWSCKGNFLVVGGPKCAEGWLQFISADDATSVAKCEHPMFNEVHWDPTGRYVASVVSSHHQKNDNSIWIWTCIGKFLYKMQFFGLRTFAWRPRPPTLLSKEQLEKIERNMSKYEQRLANEDSMLTSKATRELFEKRQHMVAELNAWRDAIMSRYAEEKAERIALRGRDTDNAETDTQSEEVLEILINSEREILVKNDAED